MSGDIVHLLVGSEFSLRQALTQLDRAGSGILLLVDREGLLLRTVTDGDLRRLLLGGQSMDSTLASLPQRRAVTAKSSTSAAEALRIMRESEVDHLPLVDSAYRPVSLLRLRDLDDPVLLSTPHLSEHERDFVDEAFSSNWIAPLGPNVDAFETEMAQYLGVEQTAALSSGTAAIHLALNLLGVKAGDLVLCSSLTFVASANPVLYAGATPVFIDSETATWNMSPAALRRALESLARHGRRPAAVIVVNLYGQSADLAPIIEICREYEVPVIEDAAESLGATYHDRCSGTIGDVGVFSFNGNKIITTSGGGMITARNAQLVEKARFLSTQAREPVAYYEHRELGYNYRMSNVLAGIGRGQLKVLGDRVDARRAIFSRYREELAAVGTIQWMPEAAFGRSTRWLTALTLEAVPGAPGPAEVIDRLALAGIEVRRVWKPMHLQPLYSGCQYFSHAPEHSVSDDLFERGLCLPSSSNMTAGQQQRVIEQLAGALGG